MHHLKVYKDWLSGTFLSHEHRKELEIIADMPEEIDDRFYKELDFGTGGLRGLIGIGTNRINIYTVRKATQGLADYLLSRFEDARKKGVAIAFDSRLMSDVFAVEAACVMAANGIKTYIFDDLRPTPELSFAVRYLGCAGGIVITASHNPKEYNGYKVYNSDGVQITDETAKCIKECIDRISDFDDVRMLEKDKAQAAGLINVLGDEVDREYIGNVVRLAQKYRRAKDASGLNIVYTPLHGSGYQSVKKCFEQLGYENLYIVESQAEPDHEFPTVKVPNPEDKDALKCGIELAIKVDADIVFGTDPDGDRMGVAVRTSCGQFELLTGNQIGALLVDYILSCTENVGKHHVIIKTIVTSDLGADIARDYGASVLETLTGFKYIGERICELEEGKDARFVSGYEESYGFLAGMFVRDKDAVIACALAAEMASFYKESGIDLVERLSQLYEEYGYYIDDLTAFAYKGQQGEKKISNIMEKAAEHSSMFGALPDTMLLENYQTGKRYARDGECVSDIDLPRSHVIKVFLTDGSWFAVRPSGTEPKLKIYFSAKGETKNKAVIRLKSMKEVVLKYLGLQQTRKN